jgi:hypothetical protein
LASESIPQPNLIIIQLIVITYSSEQQHVFSRWQQLQKPHDVRSQEKQEKKKPLTWWGVWIQDRSLLKTLESEVQWS